MKLFVRKYGEGPPLMILHGLYGSSDNWISITRRIAKLFTVYLPDLRNHGLSPHSEIHDYEAMSSDIFELASDLKLDKFFLAGHSMGGKTAVRFAMRWPEMLYGLLIADISPFETHLSNSKSYNQHLNLLNIIAGTEISTASSRKELENIFNSKIPSDSIRNLILKNIERSDNGKFTWKLNSQSLLKNLDKITDSVAESYDAITGFPVIFLKGEKSDYLPDADIPDIMKLFPAAEIKTIKNAGHWIHFDNPEAVINALINLVR